MEGGQRRCVVVRKRRGEGRMRGFEGEWGQMEEQENLIDLPG